MTWNITWNREIIDIALKVNGENLKAIPVRNVALLCFAVLKSLNVHVWDDDISGVVAITMSETYKKMYTNPVNYWS